MSDFAHGLLVLGATRTALQKSLKARGQAAFLAAGPGKVLRLWPDTADSRPLADSLSAELPGSRVVRYATGEEGLQVSVHLGGAAAADVEVALRLRTAKQLSQAHAALQRVAAALDFSGRLPALLRDGMSRPTFLALAGVRDADVALLHFSLLQGLRSHPEEAARHASLRFLDAAGKAGAFAREGAAPTAGGLREAGSYREWMEASRQVVPATAAAATVEALEAALSPGPPFALTGAQALALRERAAGLLRESALAQETLREGILQRAHAGLKAAEGPGLRAAWAQVLLAGPPRAEVRETLAALLAREEDLAALRALCRAYVGLEGEGEEALLLRAAHSPDALERKGAYALLEHTESTAAVVALRKRLEDEHDAAARAVLVRVVEALTSL
ncbi:MAG TPA: hypothetical protein VFO83_05190 [Aggregicoccus sp.]|nr:hypothetical protein [Aggregicoccus sp.]